MTLNQYTKRKTVWAVRCSPNRAFVGLPAHIDVCDIPNLWQRISLFAVCLDRVKGGGADSEWKNTGLAEPHKAFLALWEPQCGRLAEPYALWD